MKPLVSLLFVTVFALMGCATASLSEPTPEQARAERVALAERYFVAANFDATMEASMDATMGAMLAAIPEEKRTAKLEAAIAGQKQMIAGEFLPIMTRISAEVMADMFTNEELEGLVAFYESPAGQAFGTKGPAFAAALGARMPEVMAEMQAKMLAALRCAEGAGSETCPSPAAQ